MNWKLKALVQNGIAALPDSLAQPLYFNIQSKYGDPSSDIEPRYRNAKKYGEWAVRYHSGFEGKTVMEVGTGRSIDMPIACWLMGAKKIISVDLNRYLRPELVQKSIKYLLANRDFVVEQFSNCTDSIRLNDRLIDLEAIPPTLDALLELINLDYLAPADASNLSLGDNSIDYHISLNVFEHIPQPVLVKILQEARRLLRPDGAMIHFIDPSDHFAHTDESITEINFLKYSDRQWKLLGGNRFMYHNRMRSVEYKSLLQELGLNTVYEEENVDKKSLDLLNQGFPLDGKFASYKHQENAVTQLRVLVSDL